MLQVVEAVRVRQAGINHSRIIAHLSVIKRHLIKIISASMGAGAGQDVFYCQVCHAKFRRDREWHNAGCVFVQKPSSS